MTACQRNNFTVNALINIFIRLMLVSIFMAVCVATCERYYINFGDKIHDDKKDVHFSLYV